MNRARESVLQLVCRDFPRAEKSVRLLDNDVLKTEMGFLCFPKNDPCSHGSAKEIKTAGWPEGGDAELNT